MRRDVDIQYVLLVVWSLPRSSKLMRRRHTVNIQMWSSLSERRLLVQLLQLLRSHRVLRQAVALVQQLLLWSSQTHHGVILLKHRRLLCLEQLLMLK